jgi:hypothetical protein
MLPPHFSDSSQQPPIICYNDAISRPPFLHHLALFLGPSDRRCARGEQAATVEQLPRSSNCASQPNDLRWLRT